MAFRTSMADNMLKMLGFGFALSATTVLTKRLNDNNYVVKSPVNLSGFSTFRRYRRLVTHQC